MKHKLKKILFLIVLTLGFTMNVSAKTTVEEDVSKYDGDVYIIGSSKFDNDVIVTGTMAGIAGGRETLIQYLIYNNYEYDPTDLRIYYYSELDSSWSVLPVTADEEFRELTDEEVEELTQDLKIYYVNEEEKTIEVPYEVELEEGYSLEFYAPGLNKDSEVKHENGKLLIPATTLYVEIYASNGEEEIYLDSFEPSDSGFVNSYTAVRNVEDFNKALASSEIEYIYLEADIDLPTALEITKEVTIDLNGYNLTVTEDTAGDGVFHVLEGGDLTIEGEGTIDGVGKNNYNIAIFAEAGRVTINGGLYTNVNTVQNPEDKDNQHYDLIYAKGTAEIIINGGRFEGKTPAWLLNQNDKARETSSITVYGGTFVGFNPANNAAEGQGTNFVAEGYKVVEIDGEYTVLEEIVEE